MRSEKKTSRLPKYDGAWANLQLTGASDLVLDGRGATLLLHPDNRFLMRRHCRNIRQHNPDVRGEAKWDGKSGAEEMQKNYPPGEKPGCRIRDLPI